MIGTGTGAPTGPRTVPLIGDSQPRPLAIYVHWPYCLSKCPYCDFNSRPRDRGGGQGAGGVDEATWCAALLRELDHYAELIGRRGWELASVFFGGGTPSLLAPATVGAVLERMAALWPCDPALEVSLEANPAAADAVAFAGFRTAGVNRLSLGIQALEERDLRRLGRRHTVAEALSALEQAGALFPRVSFDLIYGRPGQTVAAWERELATAIRLTRGHLSAYMLTIEPGTLFHAFQSGKSRSRDRLPMPDEDTSAAQFDLTQAMLEAAGLPAYEISNHGAPGQESRHNLLYWRCGTYLGLGPGAHGRLDLPGHPADLSVDPSTDLGVCADRSGRREIGVGGDVGGGVGGGRLATCNQTDPATWAAAVLRYGHGGEPAEVLSAVERFEELLLMGLRLREGIPADQFPALTGRPLAAWLPRPVRAPLIEAGLLDDDETVLRATAGGRRCLDPLVLALVRSSVDK